MRNKVTKGVILIPLFTLVINISLSGQRVMPEVMNNGTIKEQMDYVTERTRIYEDYRAIREDIYQKLKNNALDSISDLKGTINSLNVGTQDLNGNIESLNNKIISLNEELSEAVVNRDSLMFFGIRMTKSAYNKLLWAIIIGLSILTVIVFLSFRRSFVVTRVAKTDLEDIKKEFEEFRKVAHENKEKLIVGHFNEIKKLRESHR